MITLILFLAVCFVAFTNGANANFKGVASLYGSGMTSLRTAALWGTATTFAGSITTIFFTGALLTRFTGKGIVSDSLVASPSFAASVAIGAALTSFLATRLAFPVSTTHALVGALFGAGLVGNAADVRYAALLTAFVVPLLFSPAVATVLGAVVYLIFRMLRITTGQRTPLLDALHFTSGGAASFARGLNDTPKMAALMLAVPGMDWNWAFIVVAVAIALGGLLDIDRVAETLGKRVTGMNPHQGFAASFVTAALVTTASFHSLPVSTTHVSVGSLAGMGGITGQTHWKKVGEIFLAWVTTLPCGALCAALAYLPLSRLH